MKLPREMTKRQQEIYDVIVVYTREHGVSPSYRDVAATIGVSTSVIHKQIDYISRKGYIQKEPYEKRSFRITE